MLNGEPGSEGVAYFTKSRLSECWIGQGPADRDLAGAAFWLSGPMAIFTTFLVLTTRQVGSRSRRWIEW